MAQLELLLQSQRLHKNRSLQKVETRVAVVQTQRKMGMIIMRRSLSNCLTKTMRKRKIFMPHLIMDQQEEKTLGISHLQASILIEGHHPREGIKRMRTMNIRMMIILTRKKCLMLLKDASLKLLMQSLRQESQSAKPSIPSL